MGIGALCASTGRRVLPLVVLGFMAIACGPATARDLSMDDLTGHWCSTSGEYFFSRERLRVKLPNGTGRVIDIRRFEASPDWINIIWATGGNTVYWKFSSDGQTMHQHLNESGDRGPDITFHRCSR